MAVSTSRLDDKKNAYIPIYTTVMLMLMCSKAIQGVTEVWDMETMPNQDHFSVEGFDDRTMTQDGGKEVIVHENLMARYRIVGDEG